MPPTPTQKNSETKKLLSDQVNDAESEKVEFTEADLVLVDGTFRSTGGAGETPVKKLLKKSTKIEDDKAGKKINSAVIDKIPKKNAQRAKGSISLRKTIEKTGAEFSEKKRLEFDSSESISTTKEEDNFESAKIGTDGRRTQVSVRNKGSKTTTKKPARKDSKDSKSKIQKPWMDAEEKLSSKTLEKKIMAETITKENFSEVENTEIRPLNPPFATCSFFEKLQQGVKSYFSSKNSFTPYDKNKKEGGSQYSASVANGVKEDAKKKDPGLIIKNDIYNLESDLFHDELKSNSNLGERSNNFSNDKPKIFRKLKRKKLYHPKKHYVRIQIPRKGYFYRSTIQFKTPGSPASDQFERLEPHDTPTTKSKIQIPRLASTSSKVSNLPNKKRLKAKQENPDEGSNLGSVLSDDSFSYEYFDRVSSALNDEKFNCKFGQKFNDYLALHLPSRNLHTWKKKKPRLRDDKISEFVSPEQEGGKQMKAISERFLKTDSQKAINGIKKKNLNMEKKFSEILDITSERALSTIKKQKRTSESTFETLINCINSTLRNDELFYDLEITPVNSVKEDVSETHTEPSNPQVFAKTPLQFTETVSAFNNFNYSTPVDNSVNSETLYLSPVSPTTFYPPDFKPIGSLMEEVDLHLELQNYLKEYNNFTKKKTKSTQENNFSSCVDCLNEKNKFSEVRGSKSSLSFASATSKNSFEDESGNQSRGFLDCKSDMMSLSEERMGLRSSGTFNLRANFTSRSSGIRKIKSENNSRILSQDSKLNSSIKRTFGKTSFHLLLLNGKETMTLRQVTSINKNLSTENSNNRYKKITPFDIKSNNSCNDTRTKNKSRVLFENRIYSLSADSIIQRVWKAASDMKHSDTKSSSTFKTEEPIRSTLNNESSTSEMIISPNLPSLSNIAKWSPTLQDLIDIYNSVLKQSRKIRRSSKNSVNNCFSSHLFSFLNEKLQEKQFKANLIKLSKDLNNNYKPPKTWKLLKTKKEDPVGLKEYVAMFQEILQSSLSISQITRLNNIMSNLQDYSERNYSFFQNLKKAAHAEAEAEAETKKIKPVSEKIIETAPKINRIIQPKLYPQTKPKAYFPKKSPNEVIKPLKLSRTHSRIEGRITKKVKSEKMKDKSKEKIHEIELTSPPELEHLLRTCFDSVDVLSGNPEKLNIKNKLLVTVKISGNRILVSRLSYFNNEDALPSHRTKQEGTSELIIESVTRERVRDALYKNTTINKLNELKPSHFKETSNKSAIKLKRSKASKAMKFQKQSETKVKETTVGNSETECLLRQQNTPSETIFPFEYDQMQLRTQHPIEAIVENSGSKLGEIFENSNKNKPELSSMTKILFKDIHNDSTVVKEALKDALAENVFTKDLTCDFDRSEEDIGKTLGPIKSYVIRRQMAKRRGPPLAKKRQIPETVRSMVDLNTKTCRKKKGRKALPARLRDTYLCYPFLHNFPVKNLKSIQKSKEKIKGKNLACTSPKPAAKNSLSQPHVIKPELHKEVLEEFGFKQQESEATNNRTQISNLKTPATKATANQSSSNTILYFSNKGISDCCSIELLLDKDTKNILTLSVPGFSTKQDLSVQTASEQFPCKIQTEAPNSCHSSKVALDEIKVSPIVLHPAKSDLDDLSFPSTLTHSDSFLKCFSGFNVKKSKLKSFLKSISDMKFYPGRISKRESESKPFVTFVLTPKQKKTVLSSDQIHIVTRSNAAESSTAASTLNSYSVAHNDQQEKKTAEVKSHKSSDKRSFQSVDKFNELSKYRKRAMTPKKLQENFQKKEPKKLPQSSSCNRKKKCLVSGQISPSINPAARKSYHECQKSKKPPVVFDTEVKKTAKKPEKLKGNQKNKIKIVEKKGKLEKSHLFPNKVKDFIKAMEIFDKNSTIENRKLEKHEENEKNITMEALDFNKKCSKTLTNDIIDVVTAKSNTTDINPDIATGGVANGNSIKTLLKSSNFYPQLFKMLKTALLQADDFKNKAEIISIIEKEFEKKKPQLFEEAMVTCESFGNSSTTPKQLKVVKIKINFSERKCLEKSKEAANPVQNQTGKTELLEKVQSEQVFQHEQAMGEISMLNSLKLGGEAKDKDLKRQNSTYFDALEKTLPDETERTGKEMGDSKKMYQRPLGGILDLNAEFGVKEGEITFPSSAHSIR